MNLPGKNWNHAFMTELAYFHRGHCGIEDGRW